MDFLDPKKRRAYHIRLITGYVLVGIVIILAAYLLTIAANGYGYNAKTGQVIQNGLLFVDSAPGNAEIYLNGQDKQSKTSARLILPSGNYTLSLKKAGYRDWTRQFILEGGAVERYVYPFLFPTAPLVTDLKSYASEPGLMTESPSQRWLLVENTAASKSVPVFDQYDTKSLDQTAPAVSQVSFPASLLTDYSSASKLKAVEWSTDNNNLLLEHVYGKHTEYVVFDRADPSQSFNVNKLFKITPVQVNLFNKKAAQLYVYDKNGNLSLATVSDKTVAQPLLKNVLAYKPYGTDLLTYVTAQNQPKGMAAARIWDSGKTYPLYTFKAGHHYLIDMAQYSGDFYYVAGSDAADRINIYKNPLNDINDLSVGKALPLIAMHNPGADKIGFSNNARFVGVENGQRFAVYDFETGDLYQYPVKQPLETGMSWMDGNRLIGNSGGRVFVMDFDGTNGQMVTRAAYDEGGLFDADYHHLLTLSASPKTKGAFVLEDIDMRAGSDLPASKQSSQ